MNKPKPIIFNSEMIRATLDRRKTQTRRVIKPQPICTGTSNLDRFEFGGMGDNLWRPTSPSGKVGIFKPASYRCPYGQPGSRLWVRETWLDICPLWPRHWCGCGSKEMQAQTHQIVYRADGEPGWIDSSWKYTRWRPSIHMPRWASRIMLEVVEVRVERVQEISEGDAKAEGITSFVINRGPKSNPQRVYPAFPEKDGGFLRASYAFEALWNSIYAKRGFGWDANPWVWVVEFKLLEVKE